MSYEEYVDKVLFFEQLSASLGVPVMDEEDVYKRQPKYRVISGGKAAAPEVLADYKRRYRFGTGAESGIMEVFSVLPGVELIYDDFSMKEQPNPVEVEGNLVKINYWHQGRQEDV